MPPFAGTKEEAGALAAYIAGSLHDKETEEVQSGDQGEVPSGMILFEDNCSACHEADEITSSIEGQSKEETLQMLSTLDEISDEMEPFAGSDEEAKLLSEFLLGKSEEEK